MPNRKFSGLRAELEKARHQPPGATREDVGRGGGRKPGKRRNPAWGQHTVMLEKATHRAAMEILLRQDNRMDVSELLNSLLADWVRQHRATA